MKIIPILAGCLASASLINASVLVDNFDQPSLLTNGSNISSTQGEWYWAAFGGATTTRTLDTVSDSLNFSSIDERVSLYGYFQQPGSTYDLAVGDSLTLEISMNATLTNGLTAGDIPFGHIRYGVFNSNGSREIGNRTGGAGSTNFNAWTGYSASWLLNGSLNTSEIAANYYRQGGVANGLWNYGSSGNAHDSNSPIGVLAAVSGPAIGSADPSLDINLQLTLTRTALGQMEVSSSLSLDGLLYGTSTGSTNDTEFSFDSVGFLLDDDLVNGMVISEFDVQSIQVIPEPSHYAMLFGVMSLGFLVWRRRLRK